ncbi:MAG TPA: PAS domain-containing sensor histidine kinase [Kofleriaceae bacterium]|nr:PAS domain-containing sensor histidine kinase [Kofleriaceae bacterium]
MSCTVKPTAGREGDEEGDAAARIRALERRQAELEEQVRALAAVNDELERGNQLLIIARDRFRALYEQAPTPYLTVDTDHVIVDLNHAAEAILDGARAHLLATSIDQLVDPAGRERFGAFLGQVFAAGRARCGDVALTRPGVQRLDAMIDGVVLPQRAGEPPRAVLAIVDITARRLAEHARRSAQDEVLAIVSHDLRGPISAIGLACDGLGGELPADERQECVAAIRRAVTRSERLIDDLLRVAHIESGRLKLELARFDVGELVRQVCRDHEPAAAAAGSAVAVVLPGAPSAIVGDRDRLHQVLSNLLGNALVHARGAAVEVAVVARAGEVAITVADRGPGIAPDELPFVFERYRQGARRRGGAGLGLAIVKGLVEAHRGTTTVTSQPGAGARFEIVLPEAGAAGAADG